MFLHVFGKFNYNRYFPISYESWGREVVFWVRYLINTSAFNIYELVVDPT